VSQVPSASKGCLRMAWKSQLLGGIYHVRMPGCAHVAWPRSVRTMCRALLLSSPSWCELRALCCPLCCLFEPSLVEPRGDCQQHQGSPQLGLKLCLQHCGSQNGARSAIWHQGAALGNEPCNQVASEGAAWCSGGCGDRGQATIVLATVDFARWIWQRWQHISDVFLAAQHFM